VILHWRHDIDAMKKTHYNLPDLATPELFKLLHRLTEAYAVEINLTRASDAMAAIRAHLQRISVPGFDPSAPHPPDHLDSDEFHELLEDFGLRSARARRGDDAWKTQARTAVAAIRKYLIELAEERS
jgi:hypothetical protein